MNRHRKFPTALASVMAIILTVPSAVWADADDNHGQGAGKGGDKENAHYNTHYNVHYNDHYDGHDAGKRPYPPGHYAKGTYQPAHYAKGPYWPRNYPHYYPVPPCNNCGSHNHNNHNHDNDKLWIGLLGGGILGYGLGSYMHSDAAEQSNTPPAISAPPPPAQYATTAPVNPCLQQREYTTKIMVGGKPVEGYGTACLQPDGSWRYGAAQPESQ
jgi:hypothetical protein